MPREAGFDLPADGFGVLRGFADSDQHKGTQDTEINVSVMKAAYPSHRMVADGLHNRGSEIRNTVLNYYTDVP